MKSKQYLFDTFIAGLDALKNLIDPATQNVLGVDRPLLKVCYASFRFKYLLKVKPFLKMLVQLCFLIYEVPIDFFYQVEEGVVSMNTD